MIANIVAAIFVNIDDNIECNYIKTEILSIFVNGWSLSNEHKWLCMYMWISQRIKRLLIYHSSGYWYNRRITFLAIEDLHKFKQGPSIGSGLVNKQHKQTNTWIKWIVISMLIIIHALKQSKSSLSPWVYQR